MSKKSALSSLLLILFGANVLTAQTKNVNLIPQPAQLNLENEYASFHEKIRVFLDAGAKLNETYIQGLLQQIGFSPIFLKNENQADFKFLLAKNKIPVGAEAYQLAITEKAGKSSVEAIANTKKGLIYSLQTLAQLACKGKDKIEIPIGTVKDAPFYSWRAFMLDESRHFQGKTVVKKLLDEMARLKLNTFHWHLVDDPAWRIEIKKYPLLTEIGSKGDYTLMSKGITPASWDSLYNNRPGSYYTQQDIKEIVKYADDRGILIIPEIEVPGHASAAIYAYPWLGSSSKSVGKGVSGDLYNVVDSQVTTFLHDVLNEIIALFPGKIIHIGGDEANYTHWEKSEEVNTFMHSHNIPTYADLQLWAINGMSKYLAAKGYQMIGWNEITGDNIRNEEHVEASQSEQLAPGTLVQFWDGDVGLINKAIEKGYNVVNSNRFFTYLDYPYETTSLEKAYSFNLVPDGVLDQDKQKILGLGCQMWGEFTPTTDRLYYQIFPRIAAYAECGWVNPEKKTAYSNFRTRLSSLEETWKNLGYLKDQIGKY